MQQEYAKVAADISGARIVDGAIVQGGGSGQANGGGGNAGNWINTGEPFLPSVGWQLVLGMH